MRTGKKADVILGFARRTLAPYRRWPEASSGPDFETPAAHRCFD